MLSIESKKDNSAVLSLSNYDANVNGLLRRETSADYSAGERSLT